MRPKLLLVFLFAGCTSVEAVAPAGFATFDGADTFQAVSPQGVMYRVRVEENEPEADLPFWREALKNRMLDAGYVLVEEEDLAGEHYAGYLLELAAPVGQQDFTYLIGFFVRDKDLLIAESAGEVSALAPHKPALLTAMRALR